MSSALADLDRVGSRPSGTSRPGGPMSDVLVAQTAERTRPSIERARTNLRNVSIHGGQRAGLVAVTPDQARAVKTQQRPAR